MELLALVFEAMVFVLDLICMAVDVVAWFKGRPNRIERREAKEAGVEVPPRDHWNRWVIVLSFVVLLLTVFLVWRKVQAPGR